MRLLFDHNLSPRLIERLNDLFRDCTHVAAVGLDHAFDREVWNYAHENGCTIVTKDSDFGDLSMVLGYPPKVVWIRRENCSTGQIEHILREHYDDIVFADSDPDTSILMLY